MAGPHAGLAQAARARRVPGDGWALSPKDWLRSRLTGQFATEPSDASATLMYDLVNDSWDLDVLGVLGLDPAKLPPAPGQLRAARRRADRSRG